MRGQLLAIALAQTVLAQTQATGKQGDAKEVTDNPQGAQYLAKINNTNAVVEVVAQTTKQGDGVYFQININHLPAEGGPFGYHIHDQPVPEDGNCTKTLAHLDPYIRGEDPVCDTKAPQTCQVGDLSGKYGKAEGSGYTANYVDKYVSLKDGVGAFIGNRSIVVHKADKTRIGCANFVDVKKDTAKSDSASGGGSASGGAGGASPSNKPSGAKPSSGPAVPSGAAVASSSGAESIRSGTMWGMMAGVVLGVFAFAL